ncbi:MAG: NAD-dependent epimerase/dehydratase family protein [Vicinamibacteria bacterium]|nr:NAD-dependent epimerase/dehydratase family protein [Vicinamibacteria bacterium]
MRIAVTGASGFVGRAVLRAAADAGVAAVGLARSGEAAARVEAAGGAVARIAALDAAALAPAFADADAVVHLAQVGAERRGQTYAAVNVEGTRAVIAAARAAGVRRVVFYSGLGVAHYGMREHCTNPYFLSKLRAEQELFESGLQVFVFRPSYIFGPGGELVPALLAELARGAVTRIGDGAYRMQPIAVADAARLVLRAAAVPFVVPYVFDLVGPEPITYAAFLERFAAVARRAGRPATLHVEEIPVEQALREARAGGWRGMAADELACLLCDEVGDAGPLRALLGAELTPLDAVIASAIAAEPAT